MEWVAAGIETPRSAEVARNADFLDFRNFWLLNCAPLANFADFPKISLQISPFRFARFKTVNLADFLYSRHLFPHSELFLRLLHLTFKNI